MLDSGSLWRDHHDSGGNDYKVHWRNSSGGAADIGGTWIERCWKLKERYSFTLNCKLMQVRMQFSLCTMFYDVLCLYRISCAFNVHLKFPLKALVKRVASVQPFWVSPSRFQDIQGCLKVDDWKLWKKSPVISGWSQNLCLTYMVYKHRRCFPTALQLRHPMKWLCQPHLHRKDKGPAWWACWVVVVAYGALGWISGLSKMLLFDFFNSMYSNIEFKTLVQWH